MGGSEKQGPDLSLFRQGKLLQTPKKKVTFVVNFA